MISPSTFPPLTFMRKAIVHSLYKYGFQDDQGKNNQILHRLHLLGLMVWPDCKIKCCGHIGGGEETARKWVPTFYCLRTGLFYLYQPFLLAELISLYLPCYKHHLLQPNAQFDLLGEELCSSYTAPERDVAVMKLLKGRQKDCRKPECVQFTFPYDDP